jgi:hypothetical protein
MATITVGTNSYVTEAELTTYATDRGVTLTGATDVLLIQAMDWLELRPFKGSKTVATQDLEWPRTGVLVNGTELDDSTVPERIKQAQMAAAIQIDGGSDLQPTVGPRVISQSVDGAVSRTFSDKGNQTPVFTKLNALIRDYVTNSGGMSFDVVRA